MNERIKELEKQSVFYNEDEEIWETDLKKFAELIVRECLAQLSISDVPAPISAGLNLGKVAIKEHFGVRE